MKQYLQVSAFHQKETRSLVLPTAQQLLELGSPSASDVSSAMANCEDTVYFLRKSYCCKQPFSRVHLIKPKVVSCYKRSRVGQPLLAPPAFHKLSQASSSQTTKFALPLQSVGWCWRRGQHAWGRASLSGQVFGCHPAPKIRFSNL